MIRFINCFCETVIAMFVLLGAAVLMIAVLFVEGICRLPAWLFRGSGLLLSTTVCVKANSASRLPLTGRVCLCPSTCRP